METNHTPEEKNHQDEPQHTGNPHPDQTGHADVKTPEQPAVNGSKNHLIHANRKLTIDQQIRRREFISFSVFTALAVTGIGAWEWLYNAPREIKAATGTARVPLRRALNQTELFFRKFFSNNHLVRTYPPSMAARDVRVNSLIGMDGDDFEPEDWKLVVKRIAGPDLQLGINEIKALPKTELVYSFKCVEGWDQIQHWAGVKFSDFVAHYGLSPETALQYTGMKTPDQQYYIGVDMESMLHPQTILAYEMNGKPIEADHGAPLRLIIPVKYGIKNMKRIGTISFSNERPDDYWARLGYDYYSGL